MGVTKLWEVLRVVKNDVTLEEIGGMTLAVDLATWICESEGVKPMKSNVTRPYLRNLFFRVSSVLKAGINLVFVLDGKAPDLKLETIARRLADSGGSPKKASSGIRSRLNAKLRECCVLLDALGVPWIKAESEAEALCAALDKAGFVDGVITNDGDAFLYGAKTVYRNFSTDKAAIIEKYCMDDVELQLHLVQRDLIALGLLLGCDYCPKGVPGIGVAQAVKLLASFGECDALNVFKAWKETGALVNKCGSWKKATHCSTCTHEGTKRDHSDIGCDSCGEACGKSTTSTRKTLQSIPCSCPWHVNEEKRKKYTLEEKIKSAALKDSNFPNEAIIKEFLKNQRYVCPTRTEPVDPSIDKGLKSRFIMKSPTLDIACEYLKHKLNWEIPYALSKVLPLVTHHLLNNWSGTTERIKAQVILDSILKARVKDHVQSLEVRWMLSANSMSLASDTELVTVEPEEDVKKAFPKHVTEFYERIQKEKNEKKKNKAEARKAERKKLKDSTKKTEHVQTTKMTDFFKARKQKNVTKHPQQSDGSTKTEPPQQTVKFTDTHGRSDMNDLEFSMNSLSITNSGPDYHQKKQNICHKAITRNQEPHKDTDSDRPEQQSSLDVDDARSLKGPVIVFSSDSDSEDNDTDTRVAVGEACRAELGSGTDSHPRTVKLTCEETKSSVSSSLMHEGAQDRSAAEVTFSSDLNFSLGCSLLHTSAIEEQKENHPPGYKAEGIASNLESSGKDTVRTSKKEPMSDNDAERKNVSEIMARDTPVKTIAHPPDSEISDSPVFMTLMERLKLRQNK